MKTLAIIIAVLGAAIVGILLCAGWGLLLAFPIKWTWNATMVYIFGLPAITWGKAWCLNFLCGCLLKSTSVNTSKNKK